MNNNRRIWHAKRIDNDEWIEGVPYDRFMICGMNMFFGDDEVPMSEYPEFDWVEIDTETLGECTEQPDINNRGIFEGDIVEAYKYGEERFVNSISFRNGCFWFGNWNFIEFLNKFRNYKIIGNAVDNPNFLEDGENDGQSQQP